MIRTGSIWLLMSSVAYSYNTIKNFRTRRKGEAIEMLATPRIIYLIELDSLTITSVT
jgi:hypothetical protein